MDIALDTDDLMQVAGVCARIIAKLRERDLPFRQMFVDAGGLGAGIYDRLREMGYGDALLWDVHQACTRMVRADYCGNGKAHTRDGTPINIYDRLGIQKVDSDSDTTFEAAWGPEGAVCVRKVRIPEDYSLQELERSCPRLKGRIGNACTEHRSLRSDDTLILNRS